MSARRQGHDDVVPERSPDLPTSHVVRLVAFPRRLFAAADDQWEGMLREYTLRGLGGTAQSYRDDEIAQASDALRLLVDAAGPVGRPLSLAEPTEPTREVEISSPVAFAVLQAILDDGRRLAESGALLTLPSLPEVVALRDWLCGEVADQTAGAEPKPWRLHASLGDPYDTAAAPWDRSLEPPAETAWLVGDDHNRIVAASPAALTLLGWEEQDLVGQRLLAVIPHHLREAHLAGFIRSAVSGDAPLLGRPLALPALGRDGREIPVTLTLTRHDQRGDRHVYLALLDAERSDVPDEAGPA